jgi:hypothetical protein
VLIGRLLDSGSEKREIDGCKPTPPQGVSDDLYLIEDKNLNLKKTTTWNRHSMM